MTDPTTQPRADYPWNPDLEDGTYRNPIICADYSDPDVIRDGGDFWLVASSFNCTPGLPILHSRDLVNWTIVNHAIKNLPDPRGVYDMPQHGCGVWAPAIRWHAGKFWIFFPQVDEGIYVTTADDPRGQWSEPHMLLEGKGLIDPCPLWDDDGKGYLAHAYANSRTGIKHKLRVRPMSPDGAKILGDGEIVFDDPKNHPTLEGPKFHKRDGFYYISAPAGGVATGWQLILRSRNIYGPYEPKVVLAQGRTPINGPHQGALIDTPNSREWWFVHFQEAQPYGRIVHLQPVRWTDGWPLIGVANDNNGIGEPVLRHRKPTVDARITPAIPQTTDDFGDDRLGLQWQWHANHRDRWHSLTARRGFLRLYAIESPADLKLCPNLLLQKFPARSFSASTTLELNATDERARAGLVVMGKSHAALMLAAGPQHRQIEQIIDNQISASHPVRSRRVHLRVDVADGGGCRFFFREDDGPTQELPQLFQATEGHWIGAKVGICCRSIDAHSDGFADFAEFKIDSSERR